MVLPSKNTRLVSFKLLNLNHEDGEIFASSDEYFDSGFEDSLVEAPIDYDSCVLNKQNHDSWYKPILVTQKMVDAVHKRVYSQEELIPTMSTDEIHQVLKAKDIFSKDDYVKEPFVHENKRGFYSDGEEDVAPILDHDSFMVTSKELLRRLTNAEKKRKQKEEELAALTLALHNVPVRKDSPRITRSKSKSMITFKIPKQNNRYGFRH